ncbi:phospholipase D-like domain-containing protein [Massilia scottii]|uniref:phospholipase D-like domain-containing protein n=1 Tax=Massilia scottii TaxID=3057166 RepID=UPI0027966D68|nr:phospholipase D-like domain-containing protein [Massilia sp. CCM 9029]MDQ1831454.1 phospholipase D-like domain-containing protein [Massilia sp. CCM 9029]
MTPLRRALAALLALVLGPQAQAGFSIPGYELVHTAPVETTLVNADLRSSAAVWSQLFDEARSEIVIGQFYAISKAGTPFDKVVERLEAAGARGVKIRFLLDKKGIGLSDPATLERLRRIPNLDMRVLDYAQLTGTGIIHAKYIAVDKTSAFIGSQNFDWRAFTHIQETGLLITDAAMVAQVRAVFERDWQAQSLLAANLAVPRAAPVAMAAPGAAQLVASPAAFNPSGVADSEVVLPALLADARTEVRIQLLDYAPLGYGPDSTRPYYGVIDNAVRAAAGRGVKIKLMVSNWSTDQPGIAYLKSLALLPNVEVRIVTLPPAASGPIPFARVIHSKTMSIDGKLAWIGTSNWAGGYFDKSRNLEVVLRNEKMAQRLGALHEQTWSSSYAQPIDIGKDYPKPNKGNE